jgi:hypothetical protein
MQRKGALFQQQQPAAGIEESRQHGYEKHSRRSKHCGVICYNWICRGERQWWRRRRQSSKDSPSPPFPHPRSPSVLFTKFCVCLFNQLFFFSLTIYIISSALAVDVALGIMMQSINSNDLGKSAFQTGEPAARQMIGSYRILAFDRVVLFEFSARVNWR